MASHEMAQAMTELKVGVNNLGAYELYKMSKEQYLQFRNVFINKRAYNKLWLANHDSKAMELLLNCFVLILCKKIPSELNLAKVDSLHTKVKLLSPANFIKDQ
jgi:hypothetical protein